MKKRVIGIALLAFGIALASLSMAASDLHVLLVGPSETHPTVARVRQELSLLGIDVIVIRSDVKDDLATLARAHNATAVARVEDTPPEIVLWVDAAHSVGAPQESRVSDSLSSAADPGLLALRAVELLRGRLLPVPASEIATAAPVSAPTTTPSATPTATAAPIATTTLIATAAPIATTAPSARPTAGPDATATLRASRGNIHVGPAIVASPGGVPAAPMIRLGGAYRVIAPVELSALLVVPLVGSTVSATEGEMELRMLLAGAGASVHVLGSGSALSLRAGGGVGVATFFFDGRANPPFLSASGTRASAMPYIEIGGAYRVSSVLGFRADMLAALARPEPVLVIAGNRIASFGSPLVLASIALEIHP